MRTLVIDSTWKPVSFVKNHRAIVMLLKGKVDLITTWNEKIQSINEQFDSPAIVRLKWFVSQSLSAPRFRRKVLFSRDNCQCQYCDKELSWRTMTIDHIVPKCRGGKTSWQNCVVSCFACNEKKGHKSLKDSGLTLKNIPKEPRPQHFWLTQDHSMDIAWHPEWELFLGKQK